MDASPRRRAPCDGGLTAPSSLPLFNPRANGRKPVHSAQEPFASQTGTEVPGTPPLEALMSLDILTSQVSASLKLPARQN